MELKCITYIDTKEIWSQSQDGTRFEQNGKYGFKDRNGKVLLEPIFDQIEQCKEHLYTRTGEVVKKYFPNGIVEQSTYDPTTPIFYENGKMGIKKDRKILFPAIYDSAKDWDPYDVVYVRNKEGFHYFDHKGEEVLTEWQPIDGSACDDEPFFIDEKQSTGVIVTRKLVEKRYNNNCVKYGDNWVEFDRFPKKDIEQIIGSCELVPLPEDAFDGINSPSTYIYEGFIARSRKQNPVDDCVNQLCLLQAYASSWKFITKIWVHPESEISLEKLKKFWLIFSAHSDLYKHKEIVSRFDVEDWLRIGIGYDKNLAKDEVKVLQIHYFTDRWPDLIESKWVNGLRKLKVEPLKEIKQKLDAHIEKIRESEGDNTANTIHHEILEGCHISSNIQTELTAEEEFAKYDYLKSIGFHCLDTLWYTCRFMLTSMTDNSEEPVPIPQAKLEFITAKIHWLLNNGTALNHMNFGLTALDMVSLVKKMHEFMESPPECQIILSDLEIMMRKHGCRYVREFNKDDMFWREFKPGWRDETPFSVKPYTNKVTIGEEKTLDETSLNDLINL